MLHLVETKKDKLNMLYVFTLKIVGNGTIIQHFFPLNSVKYLITVNSKWGYFKP